MFAPAFRRLARRQRGMEALQVVLVLGAAFVALIGLRHLYFTVAAPALASQAGVLLGANGRGAAAGASRAAPAPAPANAPSTAADPERAAPQVVGRSAPKAGTLQLQSAKAADLSLGRDVALLASRPGDADPELLRRVAEKFHVRRVEVPGALVEGVVLTPKDGGDPRVILGLGVSGAWDALPADRPDETRPGGAAGPFAAAVDLARELVDAHGRGNVVVVGHSAGGALATFAGAMLGVRALGYNSAALGPERLEQIGRAGAPGAEQRITQVRVAGAAPPLGPGEAVGEVVTVRGAAEGLLAFVLNHALENFRLDAPLAVTPARPLPR